MKKKAVILISGGLDSAVTTYYAIKKSYKVYGLTFLYGQKHKREIICAKKIGKAASVKDHTFFPLNLSQFGGSSLFENSKNSIPTNHPIHSIGKKIPSTYIPSRNTIFLSIALAYTETIKADAIFIGVTSTDYSGYPDCRPEFIRAFQSLVNISTKKTIEGKTITIQTPLISLTKYEIIIKGSGLNVPFEKTWSCYQGNKKACGVCDSCQLRLKGFKEAGFPDPLIYEKKPDWK